MHAQAYQRGPVLISGEELDVEHNCHHDEPENQRDKESDGDAEQAIKFKCLAVQLDPSGRVRAGWFPLASCGRVLVASLSRLAVEAGLEALRVSGKGKSQTALPLVTRRYVPPALDPQDDFDRAVYLLQCGEVLLINPYFSLLQLENLDREVGSRAGGN